MWIFFTKCDSSLFVSSCFFLYFLRIPMVFISSGDPARMRKLLLLRHAAKPWCSVLNSTTFSMPPWAVRQISAALHSFTIEAPCVEDRLFVPITEQFICGGCSESREGRGPEQIKRPHQERHLPLYRPRHWSLWRTPWPSCRCVRVTSLSCYSLPRPRDPLTKT